MSEENKALIRKAFDVINKGDASGLKKHLDTKFHNVYEDVLKRAHTAFPDMRLVVDDVIAEGDKVVTRWTLVGTHKGEARQSRMGIVKPTGKHLTVHGITIHRISDNRIVESWGETGKLEALEQLGLLDEFTRKVAHAHNG
jgi:predicted ester cyclase